MKKAIVAILALTLVCTSVLGQDGNAMRFGLKLAPNMGFLNSDSKSLKANGSGLGYTFGLLAEFPIGDQGNYRFATGLNLNNIVAKWKQDFSYYDEINGPLRSKELQTDVRLQYIELPLSLKMMTNEIGYMRYYAQVGIGNAFNIRAKADQVLPTYDQSGVYVTSFTESTGDDVQSDINLYKASLIVGAGLEYNFSGNTSLLVGVTYNNGFTNILNFDLDANNKAKAKAHYLELTTGIFF